ncbi:hypothetical protein Agub_g12293, partial [Astrephomene gubernaculifera]
MELDDVPGWLEAIKTDAGRRTFLESNIGGGVSLFKRTVDGARFDESLVLLIRLLRNSVPLGDVAAIIQGDAVAAVSQAIALVAAKNDSELGLQITIACSQLLANLANSGQAGANAVWEHCYPVTFSRLVGHPRAQVHEPATLALYACCRQDVHCSQALCGVTATGGSAAAAASALSAATGAAAAGVDAAVAARGIWRALLGRLQAEDDNAAAPHPVGPSASSSSGHSSFSSRGGSAGSRGHEWTALLCGCVALRQGLLRPLLVLLAPAPGERAGEAGMGLEPATATATTAATATADACVSRGDQARRRRQQEGCGGLWPVLLYVLAQELYELRGSVEVDVGTEEQGQQQEEEVQQKEEQQGRTAAEECEEVEAAGTGAQERQRGERGVCGRLLVADQAACTGSGAGTGAAEGAAENETTASTTAAAAVRLLPAVGRPLGRALLCVAGVVEAAARRCALSSSASSPSTSFSALPASPAAAAGAAAAARAGSFQGGECGMEGVRRMAGECGTSAGTSISAGSASATGARGGGDAV